MKTLSSFCFLLLVALVVSAPAQTDSAKSPFSGQPVFNMAGEQAEDAKVKLARQLLLARKIQAATDLLESVLETNPTSAVAQNLLHNCYQQQKQYDKAERLLRLIIGRSGNSVGYRVALAEAIAWQGRSGEALEVYHESAEMVADDDYNRHNMIIRSKMKVGLTIAAAEQIADLRASTANPILFALEQGEIFERDRQYRTAATEYLPLIDQDTARTASNAERRLLAMLGFSESAEIIEEYLRSVADTAGGERLSRLLADYYLRSERFDDAASFARRQDSLGSQDGRSLLSYLRQCKERGAYAPMIPMCDYLLIKYTASSVVHQTRFYLAGAQAKLGHPVEAVATYREILTTAEHPVDKGDALYGIGEVYFEHLHQYDRALVYFDSVASGYRRGLSGYNAIRSIPLCHLRTGNLEQARDQFVKLRADKLTEEMKEEVSYYLGLLDFFENAYDSAETSFRRLMVDYPRGYYVNDALQMILVLSETAESPDLLADFARMLFLEESHQIDSVRLALTQLAEASDQSLADLALYRLFSLELAESDSTAAAEAIGRLVTEHPESYYLPFGLKVKADMLIVEDDTSEEARAIYQSLLENYPTYPFVSEVRKTLRALIVELPVG